MQMLIERDELLKALGYVHSVPSAKSDVPILTHLLIGCDAQGGTVRATDTDIDISVPFKAEVKGRGCVAVGARLLHDIAKRMPSGTISLSIVKERLRVISGKSRFELAILTEDMYPALATEAKAEVWRFEIEADRLRGMLAGVRHAVSKDEGRYYLGGVYLHVIQDEPIHLRAVATNGHSLAMQSCLAPVGSYGMPGIIIPRETCAHIIKVLPDAGQLVELRVSERFVWLDLPGGLSLGSKLIDGTYPDYPRVIPTTHPHYVRLEADVLAAAIDRVATLCDADHAGIVLFVNPSGQLTVSVERPDLGSGRDRIEHFEVEGAKVAIGINYRYLTEMLKSYSGGTVEIRYQSAADPIVMTVAGSDAGLQVLMPMRTNVSDMLEEAA